LVTIKYNYQKINTISKNTLLDILIEKNCTKTNSSRYYLFWGNPPKGTRQKKSGDCLTKTQDFVKL